MRFAVIADIHANCIALDAVLEDLAHEQYDEIVCLGDISKPGPQPCECLRRIRELGCSVVMGNNDAWFVHYRDNKGVLHGPDQIKAIDRWCASKLSDADIDFFRALPLTIECQVDEELSVLFYHASPRNYIENIFVTTPDDELETMIYGSNAMLLVGGHTHMQMLRRKGLQTIVNVGSVGRPFIRDRTDEPNPYIIPPVAEYAMIDFNRRRLSVDFRQVPIDLERLKQVGLDRGMPHSEWLFSHHIDWETYALDQQASNNSSGE